MKHGSLFSGIGGFDLASQWMGWDNVFHCEIKEDCRNVLKYYWPKAYSHEDITNTDFSIYRGTIDVLTGGFPCQDASIAKQWGQGQKGLQGERTGLLYSMVRAIKEVRPRYVVAENVSNILETNGGSDFSTILTELSAMGYNAEWRVCHASDVGAPHHRARLYLVAYPLSIRLHEGETFFSNVSEKTSQKPWFAYGTSLPIVRAGKWDGEPPILCLDNGISGRLVRKALHAYGNAIIPEIAYRIFKAIEHIDKGSYCKYGYDTCTNKDLCNSCDDGSNYELWQ